MRHHRTLPSLQHRDRHLDRRGAASLVFAMGAIALFGVVGLATEGGTWYLEKRRGQNAADAAAMSGALALANGQDAATSGRKAAALIGDDNGLTIATGNFSNGTFTANATPANAVRAVVSATQKPLFSALFLDSEVMIRESTVAIVAATGPVCMLAGAGGLSFGGSTSVKATGCTLASNKTGSQSIVGASSAHVSPTQSLVSSGGCSGCSGLSTPPLTYQPATPIPAALASIEALQLPAPGTNGATCNTTSHANENPVPFETAAQLNCDGLQLNGNRTLDLTPGTYIFYNSDVQVNNGILQCSTCTGAGSSGVTIILTGTPGNIGTIDVPGNATVQLTAPATSRYNAAFNGVLFYTDARAPVGNSVKLTGSSNSTYSGAMYFPTSAVTFIGNSGTSAPTCSMLLGYSLSFTGNSDFDISGCPAPDVTRTRTIRIAQ